MASIPDPQQAVIDFLSRPASYGMQGSEVERVETHCSIVFLVGDRAYKLKRAIRYASLDYTSEALRRQACEAELRLNQRTAPEIYLAVRAINRCPDGTLAFDRPGPALDHVVVMRRFAQSGLFDHLVDTGHLAPDMMKALGEGIARFHAAADVASDFGGSDAIRRVIADNDRELALVTSTLDGAAVGTLGSRAKAALDRVAHLLDLRRATGRVRRCHGDLRLANICLYEGRPTLFDCIEFSDEIGCIDVLYDIAFLLMDLHLRSRDDLGNAVFNAYLDHTRETDGLLALPLFLSLRATTRSYALAGGALRNADPRQAAWLMAAARRHIRAAGDFLAVPSPLLVLLSGNNDADRAAAAMLIAPWIAPAPGGRLMHLGVSGEAVWRETSETLSAGCSVLIEGAFTASDEQNAAAALPSITRILPLSLGMLPNRPESGIWRSLDDKHGPRAAAVDAQRLVAAFQVDSQPFHVDRG